MRILAALYFYLILSICSVDAKVITAYYKFENEVLEGKKVKVLTYYDKNGSKTSMSYVNTARLESSEVDKLVNFMVSKGLWKDIGDYYEKIWRSRTSTYVQLNHLKANDPDYIDTAIPISLPLISLKNSIKFVAYGMNKIYSTSSQIKRKCQPEQAYDAILKDTLPVLREWGGGLPVCPTLTKEEKDRLKRIVEILKEEDKWKIDDETSFWNIFISKSYAQDGFDEFDDYDDYDDQQNKDSEKSNNPEITNQKDDSNTLQPGDREFIDDVRSFCDSCTLNGVTHIDEAVTSFNDGSASKEKTLKTLEYAVENIKIGAELDADLPDGAEKRERKKERDKILDQVKEIREATEEDRPLDTKIVKPLTKSERTVTYAKLDAIHQKRKEKDPNYTYKTVGFDGKNEVRDTVKVEKANEGKNYSNLKGNEKKKEILKDIMKEAPELSVKEAHNLVKTFSGIKGKVDLKKLLGKPKPKKSYSTGSSYNFNDASEYLKDANDKIENIKEKLKNGDLPDYLKSELEKELKKLEKDKKKIDTEYEDNRKKYKVRPPTKKNGKKARGGGNYTKSNKTRPVNRGGGSNVSSFNSSSGPSNSAGSSAQSSQDNNPPNNYKKTKTKTEKQKKNSNSKIIENTKKEDSKKSDNLKNGQKKKEGKTKGSTGKSQAKNKTKRPFKKGLSLLSGQNGHIPLSELSKSELEQIYDIYDSVIAGLKEDIEKLKSELVNKYINDDGTLIFVDVEAFSLGHDYELFYEIMSKVKTKNGFRRFYLSFPNGQNVEMIFYFNKKTGLYGFKPDKSLKDYKLVEKIKDTWAFKALLELKNGWSEETLKITRDKDMK